MLKISIDSMNKKLMMFRDLSPQIHDILAFATEENCSDLYIKVGEEPYLNRYGKIYKMPTLPVDETIWKDFTEYAITSENNAKYVRQKMLDISYEIPVPEDSRYFNKHEVFRYRVSIGFSQENSIATFRMITPDLPSFELINFPKEVEKKLHQTFQNKNGIVMFCGPTGSGKTTSMAACLNDFKRKDKPLDNSVIITLEDPIEYVHRGTSSVRLIQKELYKDFISFPLGIKQALREHPTHIVVGEIRDKEGISTAVEASRTGHKVITSFHTEDVAGTVSRMYNYLSDSHEDIMYDLISNLDFILSQRLESSDDSFILRTQYMMFTDEIKRFLQKTIHDGRNISIAINSLFERQELVDQGVLRDWE